VRLTPFLIVASKSSPTADEAVEPEPTAEMVFLTRIFETTMTAVTPLRVKDRTNTERVAASHLVSAPLPGRVPKAALSAEVRSGGRRFRG
jgi:hypothetical protein